MTNGGNCVVVVVVVVTTVVCVAGAKENCPRVLLASSSFDIDGCRGRRIVVAEDPGGKADDASDEAGIVVCSFFMLSF